MWHIVIPVAVGHEPIVYEGQRPASILLLNAGPAIVKANAWPALSNIKGPASIRLELRPGDQRALTGALVRLQTDGPDFAAVGARVLTPAEQP
jgi:hypothetical protein